MTVTPAPRRAVTPQPAPRFHPRALTLSVDTDTFRSPADRGRASLAARRPRPAAVSTVVSMPTGVPAAVTTHPGPAGSTPGPTMTTGPVVMTRADYAVEAHLTDTGWVVIDQGTRPVATPTQHDLDRLVAVLCKISERGVPVRVSAATVDVAGHPLTAWAMIPARVSTADTTTWNGYTE